MGYNKTTEVMFVGFFSGLVLTVAQLGWFLDLALFFIAGIFVLYMYFKY